MSDAEDFADGKFRIECQYIILTLAGSSARGPGEIWQDTDGHLQFKMHPDQAGFLVVSDFLNKPGIERRPLGREDFFNLEACTLYGETWRADWVSPGTRGGSNVGVAYGAIRELTHKDTLPCIPDRDCVQSRIKGKIEFPFNERTRTEVYVGDDHHLSSHTMNAATTEDGNRVFKIRHHNGHTSMSVTAPSGELNAMSAMRLHEAMQFVLAQQLIIMTVETVTGNQETTVLKSPDKGAGAMMPPLLFHPTPGEPNVWRMFTAYFQYVYAWQEPGRHPISRHIGSVIEAGSASLGTGILALTVAVEGLVDVCFKGQVAIAENFLKDLDTAQTALSGADLNETTLKRLVGALDSMRRPRNTDTLRAFIEKYGLPMPFFESWNKLRNDAAHGRGTGEREVRDTIRLRNDVWTLLYSLVLAAIGYTGPRTDYSMSGYPTTQWPPVPPADQ